MNKISRSLAPSLPAASRAQLSPVLRRATHEHLTRRRLAAVSLPPSESLTPSSPTLLDWWDPHLLDRLQMPLSRIRE